MGGLGADGTNGAAGFDPHAQDVEAIAAVGQGFGEAGSRAAAEDFFFTFQSAKRGTHQELPGDERRHGISRQAEPVARAESSPGKRFPGFDGDAPQLELSTQRGEGLLEEVGVADGHAAGGDDEMAGSGGVAQRVHDGFERIRDAGGVENRCARRLGEGTEKESIAVREFSGSDWCVGFDKLIAGRQESDAGSQEGAEGPDTRGGEESEMGGVKALSCLDEGTSAADIFSGKTNALPRGNWGEQGDVAFGFGQGVFLHYHCVGVRRQGGAGEDTGAGSVWEVGQRRIAGGDDGVNGYLDLFVRGDQGQVLGAKCVAVDGSVVESGDVELSQNGGSGDPTESLVEANEFRGEGLDGVEDSRACFFEGDHVPGGAGATGVEEG